MKKRNRLIALLLALAMVFAMTACGDTADTPSASQTPTPSQSAGPEESQTPAASADGVVAPITPEELGSGSVKWTETKMSDGWVQVTNEGGETLGYSADSGVSLIQVDGYAFKDLDRDGVLDGYEDWRNDDETRAMDLASQMSVDEMTPLFTHGGWMSFGTTIEGDDLAYIQAGGRGGVTRSAINSGNTGMAVDWTNALQALCESTGSWGIPATVSVDPANISSTIDQLSLGATFNVDTAFELGVEHGKQYRAVGVSMLLGPQIDLVTTPILARSSGTYTEDPALNRDLTDAYISGLQSTWAEDGTDLGWGEESVYAIVKHYAGAGAAEGGRNDHNDSGKYDVFPSSNYEAHIIGFFDGAFALTKSSTKEAGVMPNYAISYSNDGSLGELVGGGYSAYKMDMLMDTGYQGFVLTDWGITSDGSQPFGVEDLTESERFAALLKNNIHQVGGSSNTEAAAEGYELVADELGEEDAIALLRNAVYHFVLAQMQCSLYENAYITRDHAFDTVWNNDTDAFSLDLQEQSIIMLKNSGGAISQSDGAKKTVYIPYAFTAATAASSSAEATPASWEPSLDLTAVGEYFNVVTDTVNEPSGTDADGNPVYTEDDVVRASAADLAGCDMVLVSMNAPKTDSTTGEDGTYLPASLQYEGYTAKTARRESIAGSVTTEIINDGYGTKSQDVKENRSYYGNTVGRDSNYADLEMLQYAASAVPDSCKVVVLMTAGGPMVWSEVEPLADAILLYYGNASFGGSWFQDEALLDVVSGTVEPSGLLNLQQPASMEAVEAQAEDVPRDMECYVDADGNAYDFAFGLNWSGVINDERVQKYNVEPLTKVENIEFYYANEK